MKRAVGAENGGAATPLPHTAGRPDVTHFYHIPGSLLPTSMFLKRLNRNSSGSSSPAELALALAGLGWSWKSLIASGLNQFYQVQFDVEANLSSVLPPH